MQPTRKVILDYLRRHNRASVKDLSVHLKLTPTGIRQHLSLLERDGLVQAEEERGRVGRPALVYRLTPKAHNLYPKNNDLLANLLIEEVRSISNSQAVLTLLQRVAVRMADPYMAEVEGKTPHERACFVATVLNQQGFDAECELQGDDLIIRQHACPFPGVAQRNSAVCAMDVNFISKVTGCEAKLTTSMLRGDSACTYRLRPVREESSRASNGPESSSRTQAKSR